MKLTTKGRYGIHAMYDLAERYDDAPQPVKSVAERQRIPEAYLEQLFALLKKAGLVVASRGAQGGYSLARPPAGISVGEIFRALEGDMFGVDCLNDDDACERTGKCPSRLVFKKVRDGVNDIVNGITLYDMLEDGRAMCADSDIHN